MSPQNHRCGKKHAEYFEAVQAVSVATGVCRGISFMDNILVHSYYEHTISRTKLTNFYHDLRYK